MELQVFNKDAALKKVMNSEEMLSELVRMFITHNIDDLNIQILCDAVKDYDMATIFRKTHNLKSTCMYVGAEKLWEVIVKLLEFTRDNISLVIKNAYDKLNEERNCKISKREADNAANIIELKKTIEPVSIIIEKNDQHIYDKYLYRIASEISLLIKNGTLEITKTMTENILIEVSAYKTQVQDMIYKKH